MNRQNLFKDLNNLCCEMNKSYNINCGGCCFVAAVIAEQFEIYNIPFHVAITYSPTHYAIKVKDRFINRDGYRFYNDEIQEICSEKLYSEYNQGDWNMTYNIKWNPIVKNKIKSIFKKYENHRT